MTSSSFGGASKKMDELLPQLLSFPPHPPPPKPLSEVAYGTGARDLCTLLSKTPANILTAGVSGGGDLLEILDPSINSIPFMYTLLAHHQVFSEKGKGTGKTAANFHTMLFSKMVLFLEQFDGRQVRYDGSSWRRVLELMVDMAIESGNLALAISPVRTAILRMDLSSSTLTSTHHLFVRMCLQVKSYRAALPILDKDIIDFPIPHTTAAHTVPQSAHRTSVSYITADSGISDKLTYHTPMEYHIYGATIYIGLKMWERAFEFLEFVLVTPTEGKTSQIMIEAYKKWILVCLILKGIVPRMPPACVSNSTGRILSHTTKPYFSLAQAFKERDTIRLKGDIEAGRSIWAEDSNTSLVVQVLEAYRRFNILALGQTYSTLPLIKVREHDINLVPEGTKIHSLKSDTETFVLSLIAKGDLKATLLPQSSGVESTMLCFQSSIPQISEQEQLRNVEKQKEKILALDEHIKSADCRLGLSKEYIGWEYKSKKAKESAGPTMQGAGFGAGDTMDLDEDMMGDF